MTAVIPFAGATPTYTASVPTLDSFGLLYGNYGPQLVAAGLVAVFRPDTYVVAPSGFAGRYNNLLTGTSLVATLATGQVGTLTPFSDIGYFGDRPTLEGSATPTTGDIKANFSSNVMPATGPWSIYCVVHPFTTQFHVIGNTTSSQLTCTIVNADLRLAIRTSGSGGFAVTFTAGSNWVGKDIIICICRTSANFLKIRYKIKGLAWQDIPASQAATSGAGGTGSVLTIATDLTLHDYASSAGYTANGRHGGCYVFTGDLDAAQTGYPSGMRTIFETHLLDYDNMY